MEEYLSAREAQRRSKQGVLPEETLPAADIARRMFFAGCACLPIFWILATATYWHDAKEDPDLRYWVRRCAVGAATSTLLFVTWVAVFRCKYEDWHLEGLLVD
ncbi:hypothetical protein CTAYLR_008149 [Chrysophaeum taylorii]|uniref:Gamma-secretase subunit PEN-2 n=1 Tax=Chrysophaeum taylorii TaxID=2483200 RepID=A0AAD7XPE9_9STRA|nr:hypothetical protein CTAYLR_008149 [Chrysophaeum taylorii]